MRDRLTAYLNILVRQDYLPIFVLILSVQGSVLISQAVSVLLVSPGLLGSIRTFESVTSVLVLLAGFGAPALAVREMAAYETPDERAAALRDLMLLPAVGVGVIGIAIVLALATGWSWIQPLKAILPTALLLLLLVNLSRLMAAVAQGLLIAGRVYLFAIPGALLSAALHVIGAWHGSVGSWALGRVAGEAILLTLLLAGVWRQLPGLNIRESLHARRFLRGMGRATLVNSGLIVRMTADAAPILLMGVTIAWGLHGAVDRDSMRLNIGYYGIANLVLTFGMLPLSVIGQQAVPRLTLAYRQGGFAAARRSYFDRVVLLSTCAGAAIAAVALLAHFTLDIPSAPALLPAAVLMIALPIKALASALGVTLLASGRFATPIWVNGVELIVIVLAFAIAPYPSSVWTAVIATIVGSMVSLAGLQLSARMGSGS